MLSIVIPTLNAAGTLSATLESLQGCADREVMVVDGGSADGTPGVAEGLGASLLTAPRGRGTQLAAGARAARGDWLLFLHADTRLEPGWEEEARKFMAAGREMAAAFRFRLDDDCKAARRLERVVNWRSRALGLPYGDQGLLISCAFYDRLGGFRPLPLMEDVDLVRRIGRGRLTILRAGAITSARRYENGYLARIARNSLCLTLYYLGAPPVTIARIYG